MRVLDAGCGTGSYTPLLHEAKVSRVYALDAAIEHVSTLAQRSRPEGCFPVCGLVSSLPFVEGAFDAVWCANTLQYMTDVDAGDALHECLRVVRPGGIVAVKDVDMTAFKVAPGPPFLGSHLAESCVSGENVSPQSQGSIRGRDLHRFMHDAGLASIRQRTFAIERFGPLTGYDASFWVEWLTYLSNIARAIPLPEDDQEAWARVATIELAEAFVTSPDFYGCELQVVCAGRRP